MRLGLARACSLLVLAACSRATSGNVNVLAARVTTLADSVFAARLVFDRGFGTQAGLAGADHSGLPDNTPGGIRKRQARADTLRMAVVAIEPEPLEGRPEAVLYAMMRESLDAEQQLRVCRAELWGVASYVNGWQAQFTDLAIIQPVGSDTLRRQALTRARAIAPWLDQEVVNLREGLRLRYSSPKVIVRNVIGQVNDLLGTPVRSSPFFSPAIRDTNSAFGNALATVVAGEIAPAMTRYRDFLAGEYLPKAREALGVTSNPDGAACYAATVRAFASVAVPPDSVFAQGLVEMARIEGEMRGIATRSFAGESLSTLLPRLRSDSQYTFRTSQEIIDSSSAVIGRARREMGKWFGRVPTADLIIQPYPEFRLRAGAPGQYQAAPQDGSRPAIFLINPSDPTHKPRASVESTALHEGIPGHHLQTSIANEQREAHPLIRYSANSGFSEGWALYAERLSDEMGVFSSDLSRMGMLGSESFRAARMVVDAGIHTKGWSREQALAYLTSHSFMTGKEAAGEIDRYISWSGQAPSYMIGRNEIMRLREEARARFGSAFDIREFHDRVLENGRVPLALLRTRTRRWIESQR